MTNALQYTNKTDPEVSGGTSFLESFAYNNGWANLTNADSNDYLWMFKRSKFFDVVTYKGTGGVMTINHNLEAVPEAMIVKSRTSGITWYVYDAANGKHKLFNS